MKFMMDIREKTSLLHSAAENTGYIKKLVDGTASVDGYAEYIYNLEKMYKAIENALDKNEIINKIKLIKNIIFKKYDEEFNNLTLGYGGSINSNNIFDIVNNDEINAILVGSSSLNEKEFANIINLSS